MIHLGCVVLLVVVGAVHGVLEPNPVAGGLHTTTEENSAMVAACKQLILDNHRTQMGEQDGPYTAEVSLDNVKVLKQVVAGNLYHFEYDLKTTFTCKEGATCSDKEPEVKECSAVVFDDFINKKPLSFHKMPACT